MAAGMEGNDLVGLTLLNIATRTACRLPNGVLNVAHRGASEVAPENTIAAIERAAAFGADMVEVDVQRSKDGVLVLIHDTTLVRTTNAAEVFPWRAPWQVGDFTYEELRRLDAGSWMSPEFSGERLPTLAEALETAWSRGVGLLLELKAPEQYPGIVSDVAATLSALPGLGHALGGRKLVVQSFNVAAMKEHKTLLPSVPVGVLGAPSTVNLPALATWADQVNPNHCRVERRYVERVRGLGMECHVWTVNRESAMKRALRMGVNGVITNRPEALADLGSRVGSSL